jgi:hypothetical protein
MITYRIDKQTNSNINSELKEMLAVLGEIAPTLKSLHDLVAQHEASISTPTINAYRDELRLKIVQAIELSREITEDTPKLISVSDQAGKHLAAIEEHFGAALREEAKTNVVAGVSQ